MFWTAGLSRPRYAASPVLSSGLGNREREVREQLRERRDQQREKHKDLRDTVRGNGERIPSARSIDGAQRSPDLPPRSEQRLPPGTNTIGLTGSRTSSPATRLMSSSFNISPVLRQNASAGDQSASARGLRGDASLSSSGERMDSHSARGSASGPLGSVPKQSPKRLRPIPGFSHGTRDAPKEVKERDVSVPREVDAPATSSRSAYSTSGLGSSRSARQLGRDNRGSAIATATSASNTPTARDVCCIPQSASTDSSSSTTGGRIGSLGSQSSAGSCCHSARSDGGGVANQNCSHTLLRTEWPTLDFIAPKDIDALRRWYSNVSAPLSAAFPDARCPWNFSSALDPVPSPGEVFRDASSSDTHNSDFGYSFEDFHQEWDFPEDIEFAGWCQIMQQHRSRQRPQTSLVNTGEKENLIAKGNVAMVFTPKVDAEPSPPQHYRMCSTNATAFRAGWAAAQATREKQYSSDSRAKRRNNSQSVTPR